MGSTYSLRHQNMEETGEDVKPLLADGNQEDNLFHQPSNQKKLSIRAKVLIVSILLIVLWAVVAIAVLSNYGFFGNYSNITQSRNQNISIQHNDENIPKNTTWHESNIESKINKANSIKNQNLSLPKEIIKQ